MTTIHSPGSIDRWAAHLWTADCGAGLCQLTPKEREGRFSQYGPVASVTIEGLERDERHRDRHDDLNAVVIDNSRRIGVIEQILSDAIPPQPGEPGYEEERE